MELCPVSIESVLERHAKKNIRLPDDVFLAYLRQFHEGLSYLHDHNVLHRDLKPANILLDKNETLKIIDFGLARENDTGNNAIGNLTHMVSFM